MTQETALVTGAGAGIGFEVVKLLLKQGLRVAAVDLDVSALKQLPQHGSDSLLTAQLDVRDAAQWADVLSEFCGEGALDVLVNNAGILRSGPFESIPLEANLATIDVNVKGVMIGCYQAYPYLLKSANGRVINMASAAAIYGQAELASYSTSKFAVRGLTEALDLEWGPQGISVQAVWPLFVRTAMTDGMDIGTSRSLGIRLTPQQVAKVVVRAINKPKRDFESAHRPAGVQAKVLLWASAIGPSWLNRMTNKRLAEG